MVTDASDYPFDKNAAQTSAVVDRIAEHGEDVLVEAKPGTFRGTASGETLGSADVVTVHARLTDDTHYMLGADAFEQMSDDALLVNTARGGLIDTDALVEALDSGAIGGAALDVFEQEPIPEGRRLMEIDDVWLSPHTAGSTRDAVYNGARIVAEDLEAILQGCEPAHRIE